MRELLQILIANKYPLTTIEFHTGIGYNKLWRCSNGISELRESDIKELQKYADKLGLLDE